MPSFSSIVGHHRLTSLLSFAIARDTLPPTLLFAGPPGVGKFLVARACAATINCTSRTPGTLPTDACGRCRSCDRVARNVHVDVFTLEPDDRESIKIDVVREVLEHTGFRPFEGRRRVVIIRQADTLEPQAQNSLLKSLEEPPPSTIFVLTTATPGALLPTVQSRCMRLRFGRLTQDEIAEILTTQHGLSAKEANVVAALANGSVRQALDLVSTDPLVLRELALELLRHTAVNKPVQARLKAAAALVSGGARKERTREELAPILRLVLTMLRDIELLNAGGDARVLANGGIADQLNALTGRFSGDRARHAFAIVDRAIAALDRNAGTKVVTEWMVTQI